MRYDNIFNIVVEGADGVGKSTLIDGLFRRYNYRYMCYHRGDISNFVYAKKFGRTFYSTQRGLPFLYILLTCSEKTLYNRLLKREYSSLDERMKELVKVKDLSLFESAAFDMQDDYDIYCLDTDDMNEQEVLEHVCKYLDDRFDNCKKDTKLTSWNDQYARACFKLHRQFDVIDNQPYIDKVPIMVESTCHNGAYETFDDKRIDDNIIYAYGYNRSLIAPLGKDLDFQYVIYSKLNRRPELLSYFKAFNKDSLTCLVSEYDGMPKYDTQTKIPKMFGERFISNLTRARATVYCARDLAYLNLQTARLYEAILADNIVFVDQVSDPENQILHRIHRKENIDFLYVTPETICENYKKIMSDPKLVEQILSYQRSYLNYLFHELERGRKCL